MTQEKIVTLEHIDKSFGDNHVLKGISLSVARRAKSSASSVRPAAASPRCCGAPRCSRRFESGKLAYGDLVVAQNDAGGQRRLRRQGNA
jgi:ABC-type histidine transport system ATPase subunit